MFPEATQQAVETAQVLRDPAAWRDGRAAKVPVKLLRILGEEWAYVPTVSWWDDSAHFRFGSFVREGGEALVITDRGVDRGTLPIGATRRVGKWVLMWFGLSPEEAEEAMEGADWPLLIPLIRAWYLGDDKECIRLLRERGLL